MSKRVTVARDNRYCQSRLRAAAFNPKFLARPGAAEELGCISDECLKKYELGHVIPSSDVVDIMADTYNDPALRSWYCANNCPLGKGNVCEIDPEEDIDRISLKILSALQATSSTKEELLNIVADGVISEYERPKLKDILHNLDELIKCGRELKVWAEKTFKEV